MSTAVATTNGAGALAVWTADEQRVIREVIAPGLDDAQLLFFAQVCRVTGLNPIANQIVPILRNQREQVNGRWETTKKLTIQTTIHGLRLIADRTRCYAPGHKATFEVDAAGNLISATAYVKKYAGGVWHEVEDTAYWDEYAQFKDEYQNNQKTGQRTPSALWGSKPRVMLSKCAESLALRRAFPAEMAGIYTDDEMGTVDSEQAFGAASGRMLQIRGETDATLGRGVASPITAATLSGKREPAPEPEQQGRSAESVGASANAVTEPQLRKLHAAAKQYNWAPDAVKSAMRDLFDVDSSKLLTKHQASLLIDLVEARLELSYDETGRARLGHPAPPAVQTGALLNVLEDIEDAPFEMATAAE